jgi:hypothetical protein
MVSNFKGATFRIESSEEDVVRCCRINPGRCRIAPLTPLPWILFPERFVTALYAIATALYAIATPRFH